jgi:hypothetical protein
MRDVWILPVFCGFMRDLWFSLYFVDLYGTCESACILWIYAGLVNQPVFCGFIRDMWIQPVFCGFMRDLWISLYFVDLYGTCESACILWIYTGLVDQLVFCGLAGRVKSASILWVYAGRVNSACILWIYAWHVKSACILWIYAWHVNSACILWIYAWHVKSACILWIYAVLLNQLVFCGFTPDMWNSLYFTFSMVRITTNHSPVTNKFGFSKGLFVCFRCL